MKILCITIVLLLAAVFLTKALFIEDYFPLCPSIDTTFAEGYSEVKFDCVVPGMTVKEVEDLLGNPLSIQRFSDRNTRYWYSHDGACSWLGCDFAWLGRSVCFTNGVVIGIEKHVYTD